MGSNPACPTKTPHVYNMLWHRHRKLLPAGTIPEAHRKQKLGSRRWSGHPEASISPVGGEASRSGAALDQARQVESAVNTFQPSPRSWPRSCPIPQLRHLGSLSTGAGAQVPGTPSQAQAPRRPTAGSFDALLQVIVEPIGRAAKACRAAASAGISPARTTRMPGIISTPCPPTPPPPGTIWPGVWGWRLFLSNPLMRAAVSGFRAGAVTGVSRRPAFDQQAVAVAADAPTAS